MSTRQFADSAFDRVALLPPFFELFSLLVAAPLLQKVVILTYHDGVMRLSGGHTLRAQWTAPTMVTPFEAKTHFLTLGFFEPTALGTFISSGTPSSALGDVNVEGLNPIGAA
ncbi:MAG TPA: hypothetical protein VN857_16780, partial [Chthoniobacterales bacterium]|nr:hypothetical protein [Chthoniobacterales bacterium]